MKGRFTQFMRQFGGLFVYVAVALVALLLASWVSTLFMAKAISQTPPPETGSPPAATEARPPPPPPTAGPKGKGPKPPEPPPPGANAADPYDEDTPGPVTLPPVKKANPLADIIEDYNYTPRGKRDPFQAFERPRASGLVGPLWPLQGFDLDQLHLVGIIWDVKSPKAMITDPTGKGYVVRVNERIGRNNGYIARIREGEIVVVESVTTLEGKLSYTTKLMKLQAE